MVSGKSMLTTTATELSRLMLCVGSRLLPAALPETSDQDARDEGNAAHWCAQEIFEGREVTAGQQAPNGFIVTDDMLDHVHSYIDVIDQGGEMEINTSWSGDGFEVRGRADHVASLGSALVITDFKYGWRIVEPKENYTLLSHAIGHVIKTGDVPDVIIFSIVQPRPLHPDGPVREWLCSYDQLLEYHARIVAKLSAPADELVTGREQCAKCHALPTCPAARAASMNAVDASTNVFNDDLTDDILAHEYETLDRAVSAIKDRYDALSELMTHRIKTGRVIEGYGLETRLGQRRWIKGMSGAALSAVTGKNLVKDDIVTPAEAERRGLSSDLIAALTERPNIGAKLKRIDADAKARAIFGDR